MIRVFLMGSEKGRVAGYGEYAILTAGYRVVDAG